MGEAQARTTDQRLSAETIQPLLGHLPDYVRVALEEKAIEMECPFTQCL